MGAILVPIPSEKNIFLQFCDMRPELDLLLSISKSAWKTRQICQCSLKRRQQITLNKKTYIYIYIYVYFSFIVPKDIGKSNLFILVKQSSRGSTSNASEAGNLRKKSKACRLPNGQTQPAFLSEIHC